jgi:hypothetical protein
LIFLIEPYSWPIKQFFWKYWALPNGSNSFDPQLQNRTKCIGPYSLPFELIYLHESWTLGKPSIYLSIYLSMKHYRLFCFALWNLPNHDVFRVVLLGIFKKLSVISTGCIDLVWDCLDLRCGSYWLLNHFFPWKLNIKLKNCIGIWGCSWYCWKSPWQVKFNRVYFTIFRAKMWKILIFWVNFVALEFKQIAKIGFGRKIQLSPSMCSHLGQLHMLH